MLTNRPIMKDGSPGTIAFTPQSTPRAAYESSAKKKINDPGALISWAEKAADASDGAFTADDMKYQLAVDQAQSRLADIQDIDDNMLRKEIDDIYENELGAEAGSGRRRRGENSFTDAIGSVKGAIDSFNTDIVGGALDYAIDNWLAPAAGGLMNDDNVTKTIQDTFTKEDLSVIPDMAEDLLLSSLGPWGIAAAVAKNTIQRSDDIAELINGADSVTGEALGLNETLGKAGSVGSSLLFSALPGVGKAMKIADSSKAIGTGLNRLADMRMPQNVDVNKVKGLNPFSQPLKLTGGKLNEDVKVYNATEQAMRDQIENTIKQYNPKANPADIAKQVEDDLIATLDDGSFDKMLSENLEKAGLYSKKDLADGRVAEHIRGVEVPVHEYANKNWLGRIKEAKEEAKKQLTKADNIDDLKQAMKDAKEEYKKVKKNSGFFSDDRKEASTKFINARGAYNQAKRRPIQAANTFLTEAAPGTKAFLNVRKMRDINKWNDMAKGASHPRSLGRNIGNKAAGIGLTVGQYPLAEMAENDVDPIQAMFDAGSRLANVGYSHYLPAVIPLGLKKGARRMPTVTGNLAKNGGANLAMARSGAIANLSDRQTEHDVEAAPTEEEILAALRRYVEGGKE